MKKIIALLMVLCMTCMQQAMLPATAEEAFNGGVTVDVTIAVNEEAVSQLASSDAEGAEAVITPVVSILNNLSFHAVSDGTDGEFSIRLKGQDVAAIAALPSDDGVTILSNLFPGFSIKITPEDLQSIMSSFGTDAMQIDADALLAALMPQIEAISEKIAGSIGETVEASESFEGVDFTNYTPINLTARELGTIVLDLAKTIVNEPSLQPVLANIPDFDASKVDEAIEQFNNTPDEELPEVKLGIYGNEAGDVLFAADITSNEQTGTIKMLVSENKMVIQFSAEDQNIFYLTVDLAAGIGTLVISAASDGMTFSFTADFAITEAGAEIAVTFAMGEIAIFSANISIVGGGTLSGSLNTEGLTELKVSDLLASDGEALQNLLMDLQTNGLQNVMVAAMQAMPDEISAVMNALFGTAVE